MLDWLIIGGGVHGTIVSRMLLGRGGCRHDRIRVLDPWPRAMHRWDEVTANVGMDYLRSSIVHHIDEEPLSLQRFVERRPKHDGDYLGQYMRPSMALFRHHTREVVREWKLDELRERATALDIERREGGLAVETDRGRISARRLVLALGSSDQPHWPRWARELEKQAASGESALRIHHLFEPGFATQGLGKWSHVVVVGGGISALQASLALARRQPGTVRVLSRHGLRVFDFDTDSAWLGPVRMRTLERLREPDSRRELITRARHRGSAPSDVVDAFMAAVARGEIEILRGDVSGAAVDGAEARLRIESAELRADTVLLATGFETRRPGGRLVDSAIDRLGLDYAACGYPVVDRDLRWDSGLFVTGPLAELELGPASRNIHGARLAGQRLVRIAQN